MSLIIPQWKPSSEFIKHKNGSRIGFIIPPLVDADKQAYPKDIPTNNLVSKTYYTAIKILYDQWEERDIIYKWGWDAPHAYGHCRFGFTEPDTDSFGWQDKFLTPTQLNTAESIINSYCHDMWPVMFKLASQGEFLCSQSIINKEEIYRAVGIRL